MRIVVFGAAGKTGREVVRQALSAGHRVTAFARNPSRIGLTHPDLVPIAGDVGDADTVKSALEGQDAVISALGNPVPYRRNPALVAGIASLVRQMQANGPRRLLYVSSVLVPETRAQAGALVAALAPLLTGREVQDHVEKEASVVGSDLDWTLFRPTKLSSGRATGSYQASPSATARNLKTLPRADLAECMLAMLADARASRSKIVVLP